MFQLLLFLSTGVGFFSASSVSFSERADAIWSNPAGRALHYEGAELQSGFVFTQDNFGYSLGLSTGLIGFGYDGGDSAGVWTTGLGIPLGKKLRIGGAYYGGAQKFWRFGLQANPLNRVALGAVLETGDTLGFTAGLGLRPFTDRVTLSTDFSYRGEAQRLDFAVGVEPLLGILISGNLTPPLFAQADLSWSAGAEVALGYFKLGAGYSSDGAIDASLGISFPRYPSVRVRKPGPRVVAWTPEPRPEEPAPDMFSFASISFGGKKTKTFYHLLTELRALADNENVKGILLDFRQGGVPRYQAEEIRAELLKLKDKGIKIVSFSEGYGLGSYYLASVSDKIYLVPSGDIILVGGYARTLHLKGTLDSLGIEPDFYRVGEYKSAYELFEFAETSEEAKEQLATYLDNMFDVMLGAIERDRGISRTEFERIMNELVFVSGDSALSLGLVDGLCQALALDSVIAAEFGEDVEQVEFADVDDEPDEVPRAWVQAGSSTPAFMQSKIAIVIAEGSITTGESGSSPLPIPLIGGKYMGSTTIAETLDELREDKTVAAVVFRINSGGGSALASEIMNRALTDLAEVKPVIVSMADVAASGGYFIAAPADKIYVDATTLTGSIGILGGKFVTRGLTERLGITRETIKLYPHSDMFSPDRPFDDEEVALMQDIMDRGYAEFVNRVAEGREMSFAEVDAVARGRIWSGPDAIEVGLADEVGGIMDAVEEARRRAELPDDAPVAIYPKPKPMFDLEEEFGFSTLLSVDNLPSWLFENLLYIVPYQIEVPID